MDTKQLKRGSHTPWGPVDTVVEIADGITSVSTPSHGGIHLNQDRQAEFVKRFPAFRPFATHPVAGPWYEEDCDWSAVALAWPQYFDAEAVEAARKTATALCGGRNELGWRQVLDL